LSIKVRPDGEDDAALAEVDTRDRSCSNAASKAVCSTRRSTVVPFRSSVFLLCSRRPDINPPLSVQVSRALAAAAVGYKSSFKHLRRRPLLFRDRVLGPSCLYLHHGRPDGLLAHACHLLGRRDSLGPWLAVPLRRRRSRPALEGTLSRHLLVEPTKKKKNIAH
jgi:hypothetical protein